MSLYLVYRTYSEKERPGVPKDQRKRFYGWSKNKNIIKAFLSQRSKHKYRIFKTSMEELGDEYADDILEYETMIDYVLLRFSSSHDEIQFFTTKLEMQEAEIKIQRHFRDMCNLVDIDQGNTTLLTMFMNIDDYYAEALFYIGFRPPEMDDLYDSVDTEEDIENLIEDGYSSVFQVPYEEISDKKILPGTAFLDDIYAKCLYSVESFIKVLRDDL